MDENLFNLYKAQLEADGIDPSSKASRDWFADKMDEIAGKDVNQRRMMREKPMRVSQGELMGRMYMFMYNPANKNTLPYYDRFPLVIMLEVAKEGFMGLNLHYLPIDLRQKMFYNMVIRASASPENYRWNTFLKIDYKYLKKRTSLRAYKACIKRYRYDSIYGRIAHVPAPEWEVAVHLPLAEWRKASEARVHKDSREISRKNI